MTSVRASFMAETPSERAVTLRFLQAATDFSNAAEIARGGKRKPKRDFRWAEPPGGQSPGSRILLSVLNW